MKTSPLGLFLLFIAGWGFAAPASSFQKKKDLIAAVQNEDTGTIRKLIQDGADPNTRNAEDETVLMAAAKKGLLKAAQALVSGGADIDSSGPHGRTPLIYATYSNSGVTQLLLKRGADVQKHDVDGMTPLLYAAKQGQSEVAKLLLDNPGVSVDDTGSGGWTALHYAAYYGRHKTVALLLERGAEKDRRDDSGNTPLLQVFRGVYEGKGSLAGAKVLLEKGADPNLAEDNACGSTGATPLKYAANLGDLAVVRFLLLKGADVNAVDTCHGNTTALMSAAREGHLGVVKFLLEKGSSPGAENEKGQTAFDIAQQYKRNTVAALLKKAQ